MGLPPTKLLLRLTKRLHVWFSSRPRSPVKHSVLCKYNTYYVTNCSTEVGEHPILFFLFFVEERSKRAAKTVACPCRKHVGGHTAGVCVNTNICLRALTNAFYFSEKSDRFLGNFLDLTRTKTLGFLAQFVRYGSRIFLDSNARRRC